MRFDSAFYSQPGGRPTNEDSVAVLRYGECLLALAADGLGGMGNGDVASLDATTYLPRRLSGAAVNEDSLCDAIQEENGRILDMHRDGSRMMTTVAALWTDGAQTLTATVGDTRVYQFRSGQIVFQSVDHSVAQLSVFSGEITQAQLPGLPGAKPAAAGAGGGGAGPGRAERAGYPARRSVSSLYGRLLGAGGGGGNAPLGERRYRRTVAGEVGGAGL